MSIVYYSRILSAPSRIVLFRFQCSHHALSYFGFNVISGISNSSIEIPPC